MQLFASINVALCEGVAGRCDSDSRPEDSPATEELSHANVDAEPARIPAT